jgi:hypothetical protein
LEEQGTEMTTATRSKKLTLRNLKSLGFEEAGDDGGGWNVRAYGSTTENIEICVCQNGDMRLCRDDEGYDSDSILVENPPKTINQLKTLCRFFGIRLKEKA